MASNKTLNLTNNEIGTFNNYINRNEEEPVKNIKFKCSNGASCFRGRADNIKQIQEYFTSSNFVVIHGAPGIGKTETARQFFLQNSEHFDGNLIWIFSETPANLNTSFKDLSETLGLRVTDDVSQVYNKFRLSRCLFIFDNVENMASIRAYLPCSQLHPSVKVLITSQFSLWDASVAKMHLEALNLGDALQILEDKLRDKYREYPIEIWKDLAEYLEGIPLSLQIVSALINREFSKVRITKFNLENFISSLKENFINSDIPNSEIINCNKTVYTSIRFALERLEKEDSSDSLDLLLFIAYLDAEHIYDPYLLFAPSINESEVKLEAALNNLVQYSLIQLEHRDNKLKYKYGKNYVIINYKYCGYLSISSKIKVHRTIQLVSRKYDLNERNGSMFKTVLKISSPNYIPVNFRLINTHLPSVFKYVKQEEYKDKSVEFYIENETLADQYLPYLAGFHCYEVLQELLPKFEDNCIHTHIYNETLNKMLLSAVKIINNDLLTINLLIKYGAKIDLDPSVNVFHLASSWLSVELFDLLLESNDSEIIINFKDFMGKTILHILVEECSEKNMKETMVCVDHLISKWNADISIRDNWNYTIIHKACRNRKLSLQFFKFLIEKCNCKNLVNLQCKLRKTPVQYLFLKKRIDTGIIYNEKEYNQNSDLLEIVSYFINECEADISIQDKSKWNTLFYVCRYGTSEIISFVLKTRNCRNFINVQDHLGDVAFTQLIYNKSIEEQEIIKLMKLFIENKMDFKIRNKANKTFIEIAELEEFMELSDELEKQLERENLNHTKLEKSNHNTTI